MMSKSGDPRLGDLFAGDKNDCSEKLHRVAILGYPCDIGVERNGGRVGAKDGPRSLRKILRKIGPLVNPEFGINLNRVHLIDRGDIAVTDSLEENHENLTTAVTSLCNDGYVGIIVGGGNDQSYYNAKGLMNSLSSGHINVVNIDAHLDVRPLLEGKYAHSGSPFRQLLDDPLFTGSFMEFAAQGNQCSAEHADFVKSKDGNIVWLSHLRQSNAITEFNSNLHAMGDKDTFISFDIDSIRGADCPGVSCSAVIGLTAQEALDICFAAGKHLKTRLLDLSEFNPTVESERTSRLVANMIYYFLMGIASRKI